MFQFIVIFFRRQNLSLLKPIFVEKRGLAFFFLLREKRKDTRKAGHSSSLVFHSFLLPSFSLLDLAVSARAQNFAFFTPAYFNSLIFWFLDGIFYCKPLIINVLICFCSFDFPQKDILLSFLCVLICILRILLEGY